MSIQDLKGGDDFLLFYQGIDNKTAACQTKTTARADLGNTKREVADPADAKKKKKRQKR